MEIEHRKQWEQFKAEVKEKLTREQYKLICSFHSIYYKHKYHEPCSCNPKRLVQWINEIDKIYDKN
jgi:hypothetical protein